jgi:hypothetical protein
MTTPQPPGGFGVTGTQPESQFEVRTLPEDSVLELVDGRQVRLTDNPHDGVWLVCEFLDEKGAGTGDVETVMCYDLARVVTMGPSQ